MHIVWSGGSRDAAMEMVEDFHARERERKRRRDNNPFHSEETETQRELGKLGAMVSHRKAVVR